MWLNDPDILPVVTEWPDVRLPVVIEWPAVRLPVVIEWPGVRLSLDGVKW